MAICNCASGYICTDCQQFVRQYNMGARRPDPAQTELERLTRENEELRRARENTYNGYYISEKEKREAIELANIARDVAKRENASLKARVLALREGLSEIANEDFRGNRSSGSVKAFHVLEADNLANNKLD